MPRSTTRTRPLPSRSGSPSSGGFTLIELLVVIAIIALLASMLLVAIGMVKRGALGSACTSNLHQIAMASAAYSGENDGGMVPNYGTNPDGTNNPNWCDFLYPYVQMNSRKDDKQKKNVYVCPGGRPMKTSAEGGWDWLWNYGLNESLHPNFQANATPALNWRTIYLSQVKNQSETIDIADGVQDINDVSGNSSRVIDTWNNWKTNNNYYDDDSGWKNAMLSDTPDTTPRKLRYRHGSKGFAGQRCNIAFVDGHVEAVPHRTLIKSKHFAAEHHY